MSQVAHEGDDIIGRLGPTSWCLLAAALFGASTPACKWLLAQTGPIALAALLYFGAALVALPSAFSASLGGLGDGVTRRRLVGVILFGGVLGPILIMLGLDAAPAGSVALPVNRLLNVIFTSPCPAGCSPEFLAGVSP